MNLQDMRDVLKGQEKSNEAIFWFCHAWNWGKGSDLYSIMVQTGYDPFLNQFIETPLGGAKKPKLHEDPEICYCFEVLGGLYEKVFGRPIEYATRPIKFDEVEENDIVIAEACWACLMAGWPCRVYKGNGSLGVYCVDGPQKRAFHAFEPNDGGYVKGFRW